MVLRYRQADLPGSGAVDLGKSRVGTDRLRHIRSFPSCNIQRTHFLSRQHNQVSIAMALFSLPQELRDEIWSLLSPSLFTTFEPPKLDELTWRSKFPINYSCNAQGAVRATCRRFNAEVTPQVYRRVQLECRHLDHLLYWLTMIGPHSSTCIQHLVVKTTSLCATDFSLSRTRQGAWTLALSAMPALKTLEFNFTHDQTIDPFPASSKIGTETIHPDLMLRLTHLASEASQVETPPTRHGPIRDDKSVRRSTLKRNPINHAVLSIHEPMPPTLVRYFKHVICIISGVNTINVQASTGATYLDSESMETNITGLSPDFFKAHGFHPSEVCAMNENNENVRVNVAFTRQSRVSTSPLRSVQGKFLDLPHLRYLRIGCRDLDSSFLSDLPRHIHTLDVAFTDDDPERIAGNLMTMRGICKKLFTLALAVSPLHDDEGLDEDQGHGLFFDRRFLKLEVQKRWEPFWTALDEIKDSKVKVWEGEGPGFKRGQ